VRSVYVTVTRHAACGVLTVFLPVSQKDFIPAAQL